MRISSLSLASDNFLTVDNGLNVLRQISINLCLSIGMTMIEFPKIGEGVDTELRENMVFSMHPHAIADNGHDCLYMQETWLVGPDGGIPLSGLPSRIFEGP